MPCSFKMNNSEKIILNLDFRDFFATDTSFRIISSIFNMGKFIVFSFFNTYR